MKGSTNELLYSYNSPDVENLFKIYKEDRYHGRVYFMNSNRESFRKKELRIFKDGNDFDLVLFSRQYGVSKVNKIYSHEKVLWRLRGRSNGLWVCKGKSIKAFMRYDVHTMLDGVVPGLSFDFEYNERRDRSAKVEKMILDTIYGKFPWYQFIYEKMEGYSDKSVNFYINAGVHNKKDIIRKLYGFDGYLSQVLFEMDSRRDVIKSKMHLLQHYKDWITNSNKFNEDLVRNNWDMFFDTLRMCKTLDKKLNMRWDIKRLTQEHDTMARELTDIIYRYDDSVLTNASEFIKFGETFDRKLITTTKDLALEGIKNSHCVLSYKTKVDSGTSGIYSVGDYTLELGKFRNELIIRQFLGYNNCYPPEALHDELQDEVSKFNKIEDIGDVVEEEVIDEHIF